MRSVIQKHLTIPFEYGLADCCQFVGECVEAVHGYNPVDGFEYETEQDADELINRYGNLEALVTAKMGLPTEDFCDGDIALYEQTDGSQILGVVDGDRAILKSKRGVAIWPIAEAKAIWSTR